MATKVVFLDQFRVQVETNDGAVYTLGHSSTMNYQIEQNWEGFYSKCVIALFDKYYDGTEDSIWGAITRGMYNNRLEPFHWLGNDRNKERERIGIRIKELRKERGMEAKELAQKIGIDPGNLSRIEQGRFSVGFDILNKIANVMNMQVDFINKKRNEENGEGRKKRN